jgi:hypothetical protein
LSSKDLFLQELKSQYDKEFDLKSTLEGKANYLLTIAGVVSTLLFGFGTFLIDNLNTNYPFLSHISTLIIAGVAINIVSILFSVLSFKIQPYRYVMPFDHFFYDDGTFNEKAIEEYRDEPNVDVFKDTIIETYLRCIKDNGLTNKGKAIKVKIAQWLFFAGVITIPIAIGILLLNFPKTVSQ